MRHWRNDGEAARVEGCVLQVDARALVRRLGVQSRIGLGCERAAVARFVRQAAVQERHVLLDVEAAEQSAHSASVDLDREVLFPDDPDDIAGAEADALGHQLEVQRLVAAPLHHRQDRAEGARERLLIFIAEHLLLVRRLRRRGRLQAVGARHGPPPACVLGRRVLLSPGEERRDAQRPREGALPGPAHDRPEVRVLGGVKLALALAAERLPEPQAVLAPVGRVVQREPDLVPRLGLGRSLDGQHPHEVGQLAVGQRRGRAAAPPRVLLLRRRAGRLCLGLCLGHQAVCHPVAVVRRDALVVVRADREQTDQLAGLHVHRDAGERRPAPAPAVEGVHTRHEPGCGLVRLLGAIHHPPIPRDDRVVVHGLRRGGEAPVAEQLGDARQQRPAQRHLQLGAGHRVGHDEVQPVLETAALVLARRGLLEDEAAQRGRRHDEAPHLGQEGRRERLDVLGRVRALRAGLTQVEVDDDRAHASVAFHEREGTEEPGVHARAVSGQERLGVGRRDVELARREVPSHRGVRELARAEDLTAPQHRIHCGHAAAAPTAHLRMVPKRPAGLRCARAQPRARTEENENRNMPYVPIFHARPHWRATATIP